MTYASTILAYIADAFSALRDGIAPAVVLEDFAGELADAGASDEEVSAALVRFCDLLTPLPEPWESVSDVLLQLGVPLVVARARDPERKAARIARRVARRAAWREWLTEWKARRTARHDHRS